jgi:phage shock protein PspC (stress-responsive transcriptional regulator)
MQKVITINLNGNAYQLDESGYERLRAYLARAEDELKDNPDRLEIMADLEQAVAEKCQKYLGPHKTVVTGAEIDQIVTEMGPVHGVASETDTPGGNSSSNTKNTAAAQTTTTKRLYRITEGGMIAGVCNGVAAYLQVDVTFVRIVFVMAAFLTKGIGILAYVIMMFVVPEATTAEDRAAAGGAPFNAKDVVDRVRKEAVEGSKQWRRQWRQQRKEWRRRGWAPGMPIAYGPPPLAALLLPVFGLVHVALFLIMASMMISLVNTGGILTWRLPADVPLWAGVLILVVAYQIIVSPIRAVQHWTWIPRTGAEPPWIAFWNSVGWLVGLTLVMWIASNHIPEIREFVHRLPDLIRDFTYAIRDAFQRSKA